MIEPQDNHKEDGDHPLPSAEEIEERFGKSARVHWEKSTDAQRHGLLRHFKTFPDNPMPAGRLTAEARKSLLDTLSLHQLYALAPDAEKALYEMRARYDNDGSDKENTAINALYVHVIDFLLGEKVIDFTDVSKPVMADPRCAFFDEKRMAYEYQRFVDTLSFKKLIVPDHGTHPDDEL
jgi:hypothetical protein